MGFFASCKHQLYIKRKFKRIGRLCLLHLYLHTVAIMQKIDLELGVTLPENPLVKEMLQALSGLQLEHLSQIVSLGCAIGKALEVRLERSPEVNIAYIVM